MYALEPASSSCVRFSSALTTAVVGSCACTWNTDTQQCGCTQQTHTLLCRCTTFPILIRSWGVKFRIIGVLLLSNKHSSYDTKRINMNDKRDIAYNFVDNGSHGNVSRKGRLKFGNQIRWPILSERERERETKRSPHANLKQPDLEMSRSPSSVAR